MAISPLLSLPEELVATITAFLPTGDILNFALTCKETRRLADSRLSQNQKYAGEYAVQHDRLPLTVPTLLNLALNENSESLWHLRAFESWGLRPGWPKYNSWRFESYDDSDELIWLGEDVRCPDISESYFSTEQYDCFRKFLCNVLHMDSETELFWMEKIRAGWDEPLKGMLFALLPRVDRLNFIAYDSWQGHEFHDSHPFKFLCDAIQCCDKAHRSLGAAWPPGFQALRMVSVCTSTTLRHPHDAYYAPPSQVAPLFKLPNIKILNLTLLGYTDDPDPEFDLAPRSSTVEELAFSCCDLSLQAWVKLLMAPMQLRKYTTAASSIGNDDGEIFRILHQRHGQHLEHISLSTSDSIFSGKNLDDLAHLFPRLKVLDQLKAVELIHPGGDDSATSSKNKQTSKTVLQHVSAGGDLSRQLPSSLETLGLLYGHRRSRDNTLEPSPGEVLRAVADLVEDDRHDNLREVCLFNLSAHWNSECKQLQDLEAINKEAGWDAAALRRIMARNIDTHLVGKNGELMQHNEHFWMHQDGNRGLVECETDPRPLNQRH